MTSENYESAYQQGYSSAMRDFRKMQYYKQGYEQGVSDVLDKIKVEIIERDRNVKAVRSDNCCFFTAEEVLEIIDKYKAEGEVS